MKSKDETLAYHHRIKRAGVAKQAKFRINTTSDWAIIDVEPLPTPSALIGNR